MLLSRKNKKVLAPPIGGTRTELTNSAVPPCLPFAKRPLCTVPTHRLPHNAGIASEDTWEHPFSLPSAAHLLLRFSPRSQLCGTLCGCAGSFTSASSVCLLNLESLYTRKVRLSRTFFRGRKILFDCPGKIIFSIPGQRPLRAPGSGRWCHRWGHSSRFPA